MTMLEPYTPQFDNPYPTEDWREITGFKYLTPLMLYRDPISQKIRRGGLFQDDDADYVVYGDYKVSYLIDGEKKSLTVPSGMLTDLSSSPKLLRGVIGKVGRHLEASIVHDFLYIAWQMLGLPARERDWEFADRVMAAGLKAAQVTRIDQFEILAALKLAGWDVYRDTDPGPFFVKLPAVTLPGGAQT